MQIVSNRENLHAMSNPVLFFFFGKKKKNIINSSSVELAQGVVKVNGTLNGCYRGVNCICTIISLPSISIIIATS